MTSTETQGGRSDQAARRSWHSRRARGDRGVALVEFAIVMPLLFLLIFGVVEFGWAFLQNLDVRHGAREGARISAVNMTPTNSGTTQAEKLAREVCVRMDQYGSDKPRVSIAVDRTLVAPSAEANIGDQVSVTVTKKFKQLTGFFNFAMNNVDLKSTVKTRLEQTGSYADITDYQC